MSVPDANVIETSVAPRIVCERTRVTPDTMLTASSSGRVMLNTICRAPSVEPFEDFRAGLRSGADDHRTGVGHASGVHDENSKALAFRHERFDRNSDRVRVHACDDASKHRFTDPEDARRGVTEPGTHRHCPG